MTQTLDQLSAAATQGEWRIHGAMLGHRGDLFSPTAKQVKDCHHIARFYAPKPDKKVNCELQAIGVKREAIQQIEANAAFVAALVNAYRTGQLVAVADDAIERVARAMQDMPYMADWDDLEHEDQEHMREMARIAIAAMKDTQPALAAEGTGDE